MCHMAKIKCANISYAKKNTLRKISRSTVCICVCHNVATHVIIYILYCRLGNFAVKNFLPVA